VKRFVSTPGPGVFFNYTVKVLLTFAVVFVFWLALNLIVKVQAVFLASHGMPPIYAGHPSPAVSSRPAVHPFWPEFPRGNAGAIQSAVLNGVQILTQEWEAEAPPSDILSYYREQMTARGWRDVTEETYGLQPELREGASNPQDESYVSRYHSVMDSTLVLTSGAWSMHLTTEPGKKDNQKTAVKIYAAATPSIKGFFEDLASSVVGKQGQDGRGLDAVQDNGSEHYHTTITSSSGAPARVFQESLASLGAQGWRPMLILPKRQTSSGCFTWLVRGKQYAALSVNKTPKGAGSSVMFMEVTPDGRK